MGSHFGFNGDWDVHWGYGLLTHGQLPKGTQARRKLAQDLSPEFTQAELASIVQDTAHATEGAWRVSCAKFQKTSHGWTSPRGVSFSVFFLFLRLFECDEIGIGFVETARRHESPESCPRLKAPLSGNGMQQNASRLPMAWWGSLPPELQRRLRISGKSKRVHSQMSHNPNPG